MKKIIAVTGARSEYDLMYSVYSRLNSEPDFDFSIVVTGPHLSPTYGLTVKQVEGDGFEIADWIFNLIDTNEKLGRVTSIGNQIPLLAQTFYREKPDIVIVAGDREEAISVSLTCAYMDIPVAHFFGGDIAKDGNIDNSVRYATSKFAHIHFTTLEEHKETLIKLGEDSWRIHVVGNPALDRFMNIPLIAKNDLLESFNLEPIIKYAVLIQHPIITEFEKQSINIRITLDAIVQSDIFCFINYPNSDAGSREIIEAIEEYTKLFPDKFYLFKNLERSLYVNLLRHANFMIGNSSSGLLEAPSLGLPAINIGSRQRGRVHGENMIFVDHNKEMILQAIKKALHDKEFLSLVENRKNPYGQGDTALKVEHILRSLEISDTLLYKNITY